MLIWTSPTAQVSVMTFIGGNFPPWEKTLVLPIGRRTRRARADMPARSTADQRD
ncbi:hypothetical protein OV079_18050 [Nannocystis pusilla]|uniref:Uncharacterized protein n=1 Tax=Nannocystis pusilla TaxID=889268 RepID=A0A9X3ENN4_9BACT|nr:hypothetical protein [Nannocystis pusilla]MCY1007418.1 hypothetical protein [Nannocystis pusilla]